MELINGADRLPHQDGPLYIALGNFDGVHRGHQSIIESTVKKARHNGGASAALIFDPHPIIALRPEKAMTLLTDIADRAEIMAGLGLDYFIVEPFSPELAAFTPEQFVRRFLVGKLGVKGVFVGENYSFGYKGTGSANTLDYWGRELGFENHIISMLRFKGQEISSSKIRSMLLSGAVKEAAELLNYYFYRQGKVIKGYGIGRQMVYPTANIAASTRLLWPGKGVYLTSVDKLNEGMYYGVTNIGSRPTFSDHSTSVETHILDFNKTIYNYDIRVRFLQKLRNTKTFTSPRELKEQIKLDIEKGRKIIEELSRVRTDEALLYKQGPVC